MSAISNSGENVDRNCAETGNRIRKWTGGRRLAMRSGKRVHHVFDERRRLLNTFFPDSKTDTFVETRSDNAALARP